MNFTRAAEALHISQPALHVQVRKLSESLGVPLYVRRGRALELTIQGRRLLAFGREQEERLGEFLAELDPSRREPTVVLAAGEGTFLYLLPDALRAFQQVKDAKLRVLTRDRDQSLAAVQLCEAHLAVTVIDDVPKDLVARKVATVGAAVVLPTGHRLARKRTLSIRDLRDEPRRPSSKPGMPAGCDLGRSTASPHVARIPGER